MIRNWAPLALLLMPLLVGGPTVVAEADAVTLTLKDHKVTPDSVTVPAGQRFRIEVINNDDTVEEFESHDLKI